MSVSLHWNEDETDPLKDDPSGWRTLFLSTRFDARVFDRISCQFAAGVGGRGVRYIEHRLQWEMFP